MTLPKTRGMSLPDSHKIEIMKRVLELQQPRRSSARNEGTGFLLAFSALMLSLRLDNLTVGQVGEADALGSTATEAWNRLGFTIGRTLETGAVSRELLTSVTSGWELTVRSNVMEVGKRERKP